MRNGPLLPYYLCTLAALFRWPVRVAEFNDFLLCKNVRRAVRSLVAWQADPSKSDAVVALYTFIRLALGRSRNARSYLNGERRQCQPP